MRSTKIYIYSTNELLSPKTFSHVLRSNELIYSSECPGRLFNSGFSNEGAYSWEALTKYIKKTSKSFQLVSLLKQ